MAVAVGADSRSQAAQFGGDNPALNQQAFARAVTEVGGATSGMTEAGTYARTGILVAILVLAAAFGWTQVEIVPVDAQQVAVVPAWVWLAFVLSSILGFIGTFAVRSSAVIAPLYALSQGLILGVGARFFDLLFDGIVLQAVAATICVFVATLLLYSTGVIKVTSRLVLGVMVAMGALLVLFTTSWLLTIFGVEFRFFSEPTPLGIAFSLGVVILGALSLPLDFEFIRRAAASGAPKALEWYAAFGLLLSIIWMYVSILRLLAILRATRR